MANRSLALSIRLGSVVVLLVALSALTTEVVGAAGATQIVSGGGIGAEIGQPFPARDRPPMVGTGVIRGRVVDAATSQPLARARVRLMGRAQPESIQTDTDGTFTFSKLPPGTYTFQAERTGYSRETFPERRTLRARLLTLADGETLENVTIPLHPSSVITGRVLDPFGDPAERATVQLIRTSRSRTRGDFAPQGMQMVNDIGEFRIARVEPGTYTLKVTVQAMGANQELPSYGTTYYPGVATPEQAQPITVTKGQSISGLEWSMLETTRATVSGRAVDSKGEPITQSGLMIRTLGTTISNGATWSGFGGQLRDGGRFEIKLEPGEYLLEVRADNRMSRNTGRQSTDEPERGMLRVSIGTEPISGLLITASRGGIASGRFVFEGRGTALPDLSRTRLNFGNFGSEQERQLMCEGGPSAPINADGTFVVDRLWGTCYLQIPRSLGDWQLKAITYRGEDVTNRPFAFESGQQISDIQVIFTDRRTQLRLDVADTRGAASTEFIGLVFPTDRDLWGNRRHVSMYVPPPPMPPMLSNATPMTTGATPGSGALGSVTVGSPLSDAAGSLSPEQANRREPVIRAIPPGDYFAVAIDDASSEDLSDPAFFERLSTLATHVTIDEGESKVLQLRRVELPASAR